MVGPLEQIRPFKYPAVMIIESLSDHEWVMPTLAEWYRSEWEPYYGPDGPGNAQADLVSRCNRGGLPYGLVAIENNRVIGTVALDRDVSTNLTPSVVGLLVGSEYRRRGIATALIKAMEDHARQLGYQRLYVSTTVLCLLLERLGWRAMADVEFLNEEKGTIYMREL